MEYRTDGSGVAGLRICEDGSRSGLDRQRQLPGMLRRSSANVCSRGDCGRRCGGIGESNQPGLNRFHLRWVLYDNERKSQIAMEFSLPLPERR